MGTDEEDFSGGFSYPRNPCDPWSSPSQLVELTARNGEFRRSFQQSGRLDPVEYRAERLQRHRFPLEGHALSHVQRNRFPAAAEFGFRRQAAPTGDVLDPVHSW